jgi:hypothetical protein
VLLAGLAAVTMSIVPSVGGATPNAFRPLLPQFEGVLLAKTHKLRRVPPFDHHC